jgi:NDP-sugar pyrophosphorylase family protein
MIALILSGGLGKRLRPITDYLPKPLVPIDNIPLIDWQIRYFKKFGIKEFVICAGYRSKQIIDYLSGKDLDVSIQYSIEKIPLGTGGAIKKASKYIEEESFYVINGDVITNIDFRKLKKGRNSIAVIPLRSAFGVVHLAGNKIKRFEEKPEMLHYWMNAGIYRLERDIIKLLPRLGNIENTVFPMLASTDNLNATKYENAFWHSIDSPKDIEDCIKEMKSIRYEHFLSNK